MNLSQISLKVGNTLMNPKMFDNELQSLGMTNAQFNEVKKELFLNAVDDIKFQIRPNSSIDKKISKIMKLLKINDIPVVFLRDGLYYIGVYKVQVEMQCDYLMVKVSETKFDRFSDFLKANRDHFTKFLTLLSLKNNNSNIVDIVNKLVTNQEV